EEDDLALAAQSTRRVALLLLTQGDEAGLILGRIPRPLRPVGAHEVLDLTAGRGPLGQRAAAAELDVVGMGADGQGASGRVDVGGDLRRHVVMSSCRHVGVRALRSAGMSTSHPSDGSRTTRRLKPSRRASTAWRANE